MITLGDHTWSHRYAGKQPVPHRVVLGKNYAQVKKIITSKWSLSAAQIFCDFSGLTEVTESLCGRDHLELGR